MARNEDISNGIWDEVDFYELSGPAKLVYIWSWTNRRCDFSGIYQITLSAIVSETKFDEQTVRAALVELEQATFVFYDGTWLWVKARVKRIRTGTVQMCKAIAKDLLRVPESHPYLLQLLEAQGGRVWQSKESRTTIREQLEYLNGGTLVAPGDTGVTPGSYPKNSDAERKNGSHPGMTGVVPWTGTGIGKGLPRGRGVGRGTAPAGPYTPSPEALALIDEHFPDVSPGTIDSTLAIIRSKRLPETPAMVRALLGCDDEAAA